MLKRFFQELSKIEDWPLGVLGLTLGFLLLVIIVVIAVQVK